MTTKREIKKDSEKLVFAMDKEFVQDFAKDNFNRKLTEEELEQVTYAICVGDDDAIHHIYDALGSAIEYALDSSK